MISLSELSSSGRVLSGGGTRIRFPDLLKKSRGAIYIQVASP